MTSRPRAATIMSTRATQIPYSREEPGVNWQEVEAMNGKMHILPKDTKVNGSAGHNHTTVSALAL